MIKCFLFFSEEGLRPSAARLQNTRFQVFQSKCGAVQVLLDDVVPRLRRSSVDYLVPFAQSR